MKYENHVIFILYANTHTVGKERSVYSHTQQLNHGMPYIVSSAIVTQSHREICTGPSYRVFEIPQYFPEVFFYNSSDMYSASISSQPPGQQT